jgi:chromosome segregation ATPase
MENSFSKIKNKNTPNSLIDPCPTSALRLSSPTEVEEELKKAYEAELKKLRENKSNEIELININKEKDIQISKLNSKVESLNSYLAEEKGKIAQLLLKIKSLEESFKTLNSEYMSLNYKYNKVQTDSENYEKSLMDVRKNNNENKTKFEELIKINAELKNRLINYENNAKLHQDDLKNVLKRNANLQKNLEVSFIPFSYFKKFLQ